MTEITLHPIGYVRNDRFNLDDDNWGNIVSEIRLDESLPEESLDGIETFSHAEIFFTSIKWQMKKIFLCHAIRAATRTGPKLVSSHNEIKIVQITLA